MEKYIFNLYARYKHFLLFPQCFKKLSAEDVSNASVGEKEFNPIPHYIKSAADDFEHILSTKRKSL